MRKISILLTAIMAAFCFSMFGQSYSLYDAIKDEATFKSLDGGKKAGQWGIKKYSFETGDLTTFQLLSDQTVFSFFDWYWNESFGGKVLGNDWAFYDDLSFRHWNPLVGYAFADVADPSLPERAGAAQPERFMYVGYAQDNTDYSNILETYPTTQGTGLITFDVPNDGYYKVQASFRVMDRIMEFDIKAVFRYLYEGTTDNVNKYSTVGMDYTFGASYKPDNATQIPINGSLGNMAPNEQQTHTVEFYIQAKKDALITFESSILHLIGEGDFTDPDNNWPRNAWARTRWTNIVVTPVDEATATGSDKYVDPYADSEVIDDVIDTYERAVRLLDRAIPGTQVGNYPSSAISEFGATILKIGDAIGANNDFAYLYVLNAPGFLIMLNEAIDTFQAQMVDTDWTVDGNYRLWPYDADNELAVEAHQNIFRRFTSSPWDFLKYSSNSGEFERLTILDTHKNYANAISYTDGQDWFILAENGFIHPYTTNTPAISFTVPADGVYKVGITARRESNRDNTLYIRTRFLEQGVEMIERENYLNGLAYGTGSSLEPFSTDFYVSLKSGDRLLFDVDCYTAGTNSNAGTFLDRLQIATVTDEEANGSDLTYYDIYGPAGDFTQLSNLIKEYTDLLASLTYGDQPGNYSEGAKLDFEDIITESQRMVTDNSKSQVFIDAQIVKLQKAYEVFLATEVFWYGVDKNNPVTGEFDFPSGAYYIKVGDVFLTAPDEVEGLLTLDYIINDPGNEVKNRQVWNIQYNNDYEEPARYTFVSIAGEGVWTESEAEEGIGHLGEKQDFKNGGTVFAQGAESNNYEWRNHSILWNGGDKYALWNIHENYSLVYTINFSRDAEGEIVYNTTFAGDKDQKQYIYEFIPFGELPEGLPKEPDPEGIDDAGSVSTLVAYGMDNQIVVKGVTNATVQVYNLSGRLVNTTKLDGYYNTISVPAGIYVVRVVDTHNTTVAKVLVK